MILPEKHVRVSESLFGLGGFILKLLAEPKTLDRVWSDFEKINNTKEFPAYNSFENFVLALDYLYMIGAIELNAAGRLCNAINTVKC